MDRIFDHQAVRRHRDRAALLLPRISSVLNVLASSLLDRLDDTNRIFETALDFGGRGSIAPALIERGMSVISADVSAPMAVNAGGTALVIEAERFAFAENSFDLVIAHLSLHFINDLPGALLQLRSALRPGGLFLASMPVLGTLDELRTALLVAETELTGKAAPRVSPFPTFRDCAGLLQRAGFALPVADMVTTELLYANPLDLLHELRAAGETNALRLRAHETPNRALFPAGLATLPKRDNRSVATLSMAVMTGWASN